MIRVHAEAERNTSSAVEDKNAIAKQFKMDFCLHNEVMKEGEGFG